MRALGEQLVVKKISKTILPIVAICGSAAVFAQSNDVVIEPIRGQMYLVAGAGANITVSVARRDGVFVVDSGNAQMAKKALAAILKLSDEVQNAGPVNGPHTPPKPVRYIANTTIGPEHTGGNEIFARSGSTFTGGNVAAEIGDATEGAAILAADSIVR